MKELFNALHWTEWLLLFVLMSVLLTVVLGFAYYYYVTVLFLGFWNPFTLVFLATFLYVTYNIMKFLEKAWKN